jgi:hypothetical protein
MVDTMNCRDHTLRCSGFASQKAGLVSILLFPSDEYIGLCGLLRTENEKRMWIQRRQIGAPIFI